MNAVIIYDEFDYATKANVMLARAARRADETTQWDVKPWKLDMLKLSPTADAALTEASDAHLIVLALRQPESLPAWLFAWLETWAEHRQVQEAALAFWHGENAGGSSMAVVELSQFAERRGLSFILTKPVRLRMNPQFLRASCTSAKCP